MTNTIDTFQQIESAAHDGDFGHNQRATPSDNQVNASNYKVGRANLYGLNIAIEQPRHSYRTGIDKKTGKRWTTKLAAHYGYFSKTRGADNAPVDCFIGFYPQSEFIYVINQYVNGQWDEHKIMLAFPDEHTARKAYLDSYDKGWKGLHSLVPASISQFKWWLKNGNMKKPLAPEHLPYSGLENMNQKITWDSTASPKGMTIDKLLYEIRRADGGDHLLLDSVCMADILEDVDSIMTFDALVTPYAKLERKMNILKTVMERAGNTVKPLAVQISDPFKQNGTAQVAVVFELSDGQSVSIFFHNPDVTPNKMQPADALVSWKWLINKKDITVLVAPEHGKDLDVHNVAMRIMKLAEKNSPAFQRANVNRAAKMRVIEDIKTEITGLETELKDAQHELEVAKVEAEDNRDPVLVRAQAVRRELLPLGYEPSDNGLLMTRVAGDFYISVETKYKAVGGTNFNVKVLNRINASSDMDIVEDIRANEPGVTAKNIDDSAIAMIGKLSPAQTDPIEPVIVPEQIVTAEQEVIEPEPIIPPSQIDPVDTVVEPEVIDPVVEQQLLKKVTVKSQFDVTPGWMAKLMGDGYRVLSGATKAFGGVNYLVSKDDVNVSFNMRDKQSLPLDISEFNAGQLSIISKLMKYGAIYADDTLLANDIDPIIEQELETEVIEPQPQEPNEQENQQAEVTAQTEEAGAEGGNGNAETEHNTIENDDSLSVITENINASPLANSLKKKAIKYLQDNPGSHEIKGISKKSMEALMESIRAELFSEIKALSPLFKEVGDDNLNMTTPVGYLQIAVFKQKNYITGYKMSFYGGDDNGTTNIFDSTSTIDDLKAWGFALPFDIDIKAFVDNVIKPSVDELLDKQPEANETNQTQAHIDTLQAVVDGAHDSMELDALLDVIDAAAQALIDAGISEIHDPLIGSAAERWAFLDEQKNG